MITIEEVKRQIEVIKEKGVHDDEIAHAYEDELHVAVLEAISSGSPDAVELAKLVLTTQSLDFHRWCA